MVSMVIPGYAPRNPEFDRQHGNAERARAYQLKLAYVTLEHLTAEPLHIKQMPTLDLRAGRSRNVASGVRIISELG